jgi:predicted MPP superfamily phosphohydrolase
LTGLRLVQLTDIHHGPNLSLRYVRRVIAAANALRPDITLLTGDYVYRSPQYIAAGRAGARGAAREHRDRRRCSEITTGGRTPI